ncbi:uncharacterized protein BJ212DRAFT_948140 [Suillus subaureus]|uniref:Uncharacterized protein n=1 Tax=Suillus subaureus TaxID=48587 RepID=A0A9P7DVN3_9AGAM|nr:uncharacterized protein BJ212DRAFT_948140 [Suillus subaureus]KAG1804043.1 hypothetical protein BJ212DRAFT_948140 [Suillus subaureus]
MAPHPHQALPGGVAPQVPMSWGGYYYMDPHQPKPPWGYNAMPSQHMHRQSHPQHAHQPEPLSMSPRSAAPQLPGTSTMAHAIPHTPHTPQTPLSISSPLSTPSTASAPCLNTNARDFVPGGRSISKITIRSQDGMEVTLDDLKKLSLRLPTAPISPASPVVTNRPQPSVLVWKKDGTKKKRKREKQAKRMEEEEATRKRKADENRILMEEEEKERIRQAEEEEKELLRQEEEGCLEAEQAHIALEEKERKQQDALR